MRELVSALIDASPVPCVPVGELELPAYYDSSQQTIFVKKGLSEEVLFVSMAKEVSAAVYDFKHNESRDASDFKSFCVAYMVWRHQSGTIKPFGESYACYPGGPDIPHPCENGRT